MNRSHDELSPDLLREISELLQAGVPFGDIRDNLDLDPSLTQSDIQSMLNSQTSPENAPSVQSSTPPAHVPSSSDPLSDYRRHQQERYQHQRTLRRINPDSTVDVISPSLSPFMSLSAIPRFSYGFPPLLLPTFAGSGYRLDGFSPTIQIGDAADIDGMTHEQLEQLCESVGDVKHGLSKEKIDSLESFTYLHPPDAQPNPENASTQSESEQLCVICRDDFAPGDTLIRLPCLHVFHKDCLSRWLEEKPKCPICNMDLS